MCGRVPSLYQAPKAPDREGICQLLDLGQSMVTTGTRDQQCNGSSLRSGMVSPAALFRSRRDICLTVKSSPLQAGGCIRMESTPLQRTAFDALMSDLDGLDMTLIIEHHAVDARDAVIRVTTAQRTPMIDDIPVVAVRNVQDRMMPSTGGDSRVLLQDLANAFERAEG